MIPVLRIWYTKITITYFQRYVLMMEIVPLFQVNGLMREIANRLFLCNERNVKW